MPRRRMLACAWSAIALLNVLSASSRALAEDLPATDGPALIDRALEHVKGDLDDMRARGRVRVLVSFSRTNFFVSQGRPRGFDYDLLTEYQSDLQSRFGKGK